MRMTTYRAAAGATRGANIIAFGRAGGAVKALRPDLNDDDAYQEASQAIHWVSMNYPECSGSDAAHPTCDRLLAKPTGQGRFTHEDGDRRLARNREGPAGRQSEWASFS